MTAWFDVTLIIKVMIMILRRPLALPFYRILLASSITSCIWLSFVNTLSLCPIVASDQKLDRIATESTLFCSLIFARCFPQSLLNADNVTVKCFILIDVMRRLYSNKAYMTRLSDVPLTLKYWNTTTSTPCYSFCIVSITTSMRWDQNFTCNLYNTCNIAVCVVVYSFNFNVFAISQSDVVLVTVFICNLLTYITNYGYSR